MVPKCAIRKLTKKALANAPQIFKSAMYLLFARKTITKLLPNWDLLSDKFDFAL